ncbi:hypothetical protein [Pseudaestuariivita atlantica]|uniref:Uncharacterized protein n=1 Tax=Pseudaestuariivita atlantica TaxID=1317121 RepID=A0A0L1JK52_9RHOB|nr:hypothetical protein [Pseudaestuariivita atlantica]KNG92097.1 hypothetical protein ATO11_19045 [Pseudaestuariivita atlantica]
MTPQLTYAIATTPVAPQCGEPLAVVITASNESRRAITLRQIEVQFAIGTYAKDLATGFEETSEHAPDGWTIGTDGGVYTFTPPGGSITVKGGGLEFRISGIPVNDEAGSTPVTLMETTDGDPASQVWTLNKLEAQASLAKVYIDPPTVPYGGSATLYWTASPGSTVTVSYDGVTYASVRDDPETPLPAVGNWRIENITVREVQVTVKAVAQGDTGSQPSFEYPVVGVARPSFPSLTITPDMNSGWSRIDATVDSATAHWFDTPAGRLTAGKDELQFWTLDATQTVTAHATNPVFTKPTTQSAQIHRPRQGWTALADAPRIDNPAITVMDDQLVIYPEIGGSNSATEVGLQIFTSRDGATWTPGMIPGNYAEPLPISMFTLDGTFHVRGLGHDAARNSGWVKGAHSTDFDTWQVQTPFEVYIKQQVDGLALTYSEGDGAAFAWTLYPGRYRRITTVPDANAPLKTYFADVPPEADLEITDWVRMLASTYVRPTWFKGRNYVFKYGMMLSGAPEDESPFRTEFNWGSNNLDWLGAAPPVPLAAYNDTLRFTRWQANGTPLDYSYTGSGGLASLTVNGRAATNSDRTTDFSGAVPMVAFRGGLFAAGPNLASGPGDSDHTTRKICMRTL